MATSQSRGTSTHRGQSSVSMAAGLVGGVASFALTYIVLFVVKSGEIQNSLASNFGSAMPAGAPPGDWQVVGWLFFEAHNVGTSATVSMGSQSRTIAGNMQQGSLWESWFLLLPIVMLLAVGFLVAMANDSRDATNGFISGASVALGYGLLAVVGVLAFGWSYSQGGGSISAGPDMIMGILLVGIVYPVVLGGVGGAVGAEITE